MITHIHVSSADILSDKEISCSLWSQRYSLVVKFGMIPRSEGSLRCAIFHIDKSICGDFQPHKDTKNIHRNKYKQYLKFYLQIIIIITLQC